MGQIIETTLRFNLEGLRWRVFDAKGQVLGRLASHISTIIQGKDKPTYAPCRDDGDICCSAVEFWAQDRDRKLRIFPDSEHPFGDQPLEPYVMPPRKV
ncbi:hypothetical protein DKX38_026893 [Salix brachista]|uniref:Uncharacterized protein n=1 Tax=Salix brachista TaxID=2182728 RepID=A0A5N5JFX3_9ROSI|nr:hypothetical protein DKX38_026893 [Salix brachista]